MTSRATGSAARAASRRLDRLGYRLAAAFTSFRVTGVAGPLIAGELALETGGGHWAQRSGRVGPADRAPDLAGEAKRHGRAAPRYPQCLLLTPSAPTPSSSRAAGSR